MCWWCSVVFLWSGWRTFFNILWDNNNNNNYTHSHTHSQSHVLHSPYIQTHKTSGANTIYRVSTQPLTEDGELRSTTHFNLNWMSVSEPTTTQPTAGAGAWPAQRLSTNPYASVFVVVINGLLLLLFSCDVWWSVFYTYVRCWNGRMWCVVQIQWIALLSSSVRFERWVCRVWNKVRIKYNRSTKTKKNAIYSAIM